MKSYKLRGMSNGKNSGMKTVVLIGDSIRMGYQRFVQEELAPSMKICELEGNGGTSTNVLAHLDAWVLSRTPHIVHLNCGLHDIRRAFDTGEIAVPISLYQANVKEILRKILDHTDAKVIWATTTPVNEAWHHKNKSFDRFEADVLAYNRASVEIAQRLDVRINNLFDVITRAGRDRYLKGDGVHFNEAGCILLGKAVAEAIRTCII